ncbi:hypothetical protein [Ureibacillus sinduriensis]|nr:hypothetical protein [Ureibacillus sinduriensis]
MQLDNHKSEAGSSSRERNWRLPTSVLAHAKEVEVSERLARATRQS